MGNVIRRPDKAVPVQARRTDPPAGVPPFPTTVIDAPGMAPPPPPAAFTAAGPQNVIYVVAPQAAAAPPPLEIHHHHHTTQVIAPLRRRLGKGTSFLGTLGLVVGGVGCAAACLPQAANFARPIALTGGGLAALAWVGAMLFRRVGTGVPILALLVCAAAYGLWMNNTGQAQGTYDQLRRASPVPLPAVRFSAGAVPAVTPPPAPQTLAAPGVPELPTKVRPPAPITPSRDLSIFNPNSPGWVKPDTSTRP